MPKIANKATRVNELVSAERLFGIAVAPITRTQEAAQQLYDAGLNVIPFRPASKKSFGGWKLAKTSRVHPAYLMPLFATLATGERPNIAIITGHTSGNLFCIDCETEAALLVQIRELRARNIPVWASQTGGRKRGGHIFLRCAQGTVKRITLEAMHKLAPALADVEILSNGQISIAPPSIHPQTGQEYTWLVQDSDEPPTVSLADLDWLPLELEAANNDGQRNAPASPLSAATLDYLHNGHKMPEGNRNNALFRAACDIYGCRDYGLLTATEADRLETLLWRKAHGSGLPANEIQATLKSAASEPRHPAKTFGHDTPHQPTRPNGTQPTWAKMHAWALAHAWPGRTGATDRAVFLAHCERARLENNRRRNSAWRASKAELAELASVSAKTAKNATRRLCAAGLLATAGKDRTSGATLYTFGQSTQELQATGQGKEWASLPPYTPLDRLGGYFTPTFDVLFDVLERGALGKSGWHVYRALLSFDEPRKVAAIARRAGVSRRTVRRQLKKLAQYEDAAGNRMVQRTASGAWVAFPVTPDYLENVVLAGNDAWGRPKRGAAQRRRARHAEDRAVRVSKWLMSSREKWEFGVTRGNGQQRPEKDNRTSAKDNGKGGGYKQQEYRSKTT